MVGVISLMLALLLSLGAVLCFANEKWQSKGRMLTILSCGLVAVASVYLLVLILNNRFDISYVANYSARELPLVYKVSAFWAGQQGSFLLWLLIHAGAGLFLLLKRALPVPGMAVYMALQALLTVLVLAKSPFVPNPNVVENGIGLNPLLQDPWMAVHPPIIFVGYALLAVPFVYGAAALLTGQQAKDWLPAARRWALIAWSFLGAGIFIGGYWAYKVLGWGGFWGWDPVENSSLVPWLAAGIYIHVLRAAQIRPAVITMVHLAGIFAYGLVIYGTFLTRSGILGDFSVHSFAGDSIGLSIALVNAIVLLAGLLLLMAKAGSLPKGEYYPSYDSREFILLLGALLLVFVGVIIFLGMSMPLFTQLIGKPAAVDTDFYVRTTMPLAIVMLLAASCALLRGYGQGRVLASGAPLIVWGLAGAGAAYAAGVRQLLPCLLAAVSLSAVGAAVIAWHKHGLRTGGAVAHIGLGLSCLAFVLAGSGSQSYSQELQVGEKYQIFGHEICYQGQEFADGNKAKYYLYQVDGQAVRALTKLHANGADAAREPAIAKGIGGDVYLAPTPPKDNGRTEMILKHGRMGMDEELGYRFEDAAIEQQADGTVLVMAKVGVTDGTAIEEVQLHLTATKDGGNSEPVEVFNGQRRLRLTGITQNSSQIRLESMPSLAAELNQPITASVSVKPCIWLLWLGAVLVCAGTLWAVKK